MRTREATGDAHLSQDEDPDIFERPPLQMGEQVMYLALLEDAIRCARGTACQLRYVEQVEARQWIGDLETRDVGSFRYVCDHLGLDADILSPGLLGLSWRALTERRTYTTDRRVKLDAVLADIRAGKLRYWEIAQRHHITAATVRSWAYRAGIKRGGGGRLLAVP